MKLNLPSPAIAHIVDIKEQTGETNYSWDRIERSEVLPKWLGKG